MKRFLILLAALACVTSIQPSYAKGKNTQKENTKVIDTLSYCTGVNLYHTLNKILAGFKINDINFEQVRAGIQEGLTNYPTPSSKEMADTFKEFFNSTLILRHQEFAAKNRYNPDAVFIPFISNEEKTKISYAFGIRLGEGISKSKLNIQPHLVLKAFDDAKKNRIKLSNNQLAAYMQHYNTVVVPTKAKERSEKWIAAKEQESGVKKTASGLLYKIIEQGDMTKAATHNKDIAFIHYIVRYQNGEAIEATRFKDLSKEEQDRQRSENPDSFNKYGLPYMEDRPLEIQLDKAIAAWTEGLKLIGPGGKIILYAPAELAYGSQGSGKKIGPNEALEFEIEIISVNFSWAHLYL